jgi:hypothetical protein
MVTDLREEEGRMWVDPFDMELNKRKDPVCAVYCLVT